MTDEQKKQIIETLTRLQTMQKEQRRDYERGYLEGGIEGIIKSLAILGFEIKWMPIEGEWIFVEK